MELLLRRTLFNLAIIYGVSLHNATHGIEPRASQGSSRGGTLQSHSMVNGKYSMPWNIWDQSGDRDPWEIRTEAIIMFTQGSCPLVKVKSLSRPTLCHPMDCKLPGSSVHGIFQARILEWVAISFCRGSFPTRDRTRVSRIVGGRFTVWATRKAHKYLWPNQYPAICPDWVPPLNKWWGRR